MDFIFHLRIKLDNVCHAISLTISGQGLSEWMRLSTLLIPRPLQVSLFIYFKISFYWLQREGRRGKKDRNIDGRETLTGCLLHTLTWDQVCNPGRFPDWELNQWSCGVWDNAQPAEPHQPEQHVIFDSWHWMRHEEQCLFIIESYFQHLLAIIER